MKGCKQSGSTSLRRPKEMGECATGSLDWNSRTGSANEEYFERRSSTTGVEPCMHTFSSGSKEAKAWICHPRFAQTSLQRKQKRK